MKKEATIKAISIFLALVFVLLTPGMYIGAADADRENTNPFKEDIVWDETPESEMEGIVPLEADSSFKDKLKEAIADETLVPFDANSSINREHKMAATAHSIVLKAQIENLRSSGYVNTAAYLRYAHPAFSATTANASSVSLSSGSLNVGYPLASFTGRGGIEASISLLYDSSSSETKEKHWENVPTNEYYAITGDRYDRIIDENTIETSYSNIENHHFTSEADYLDFIGDYVDFENEMPDFTGMIGEDEYDIYLDILIDSGNIYYPVEEVRDKTLSSAEIGLAPGWRFNIPVIEKLDSTIGNGDTTNTDEYSILTLDDGSSYQMRGYTILNHGVYDVTVSATNITVNNRTAKYLVTLKDGTKYYFDDDGAAIQKKDRFGNAVYYDFALSGMISRIYDGTGRSIYITTTSTGITVTSPSGESVDISISGTGYENKRVSSVSYGSGETYSFTYSNSSAPFNYIESSTGLSTTWALLSKVTMPNGDSTSFAYTQKTATYGAGTMGYYVVSSKTDKIGGTNKTSTTYSYTGTSQDAYYQRTLHEQYPSTTPYTYTVTVTTGTGKNDFTYNENVCLISEKAMIGSTTISQTTYEYGINLLPVKKTVNSLSGYGTEYYTYDSKGNMTAFYDRQASGNTDNLHKTTYTYDSTYSILLTKTYYQNSSTLITETNTLTQNGKSIASSVKTTGNTELSRTEYTYDSYGNVLTKTDYIYPGTETAVTTYSYTDNVTRPVGVNMDGVYCTSVTVSGVKDADGQTLSNVVTSATYDLVGRKTSETDALGNTTTYAYNTDGKLSSVTYPDNTTETYTYSVAAGTETHTDVGGLVTITTYNGLGDVVSITDAFTSTVLSNTTYDAYSRVYREYTCTAVTPYSYKEYSYDALGRVTSEQVKNNSGTVISKKTYSYSPSEHKITTTSVGDSNAPSIVEVTTYDCMGRTTSSKVGTSETTYTYDYLGNVLTVTDPVGNITTTVYAPAQRTVTVRDALNNASTTVYDSLGRTLTVTDPLGTTVAYTYDTLGRVITTTSTVDGGTSLTKTYYDAVGNVTKTLVKNGASSFSRTENAYDSMNRLLSVSAYDGASAAMTTSYTYDARGNVLSQTTGVATVTYTYDRFGNNTSITDALGQTETFTYDISGALTSSTDRAGIVTTYTYLAPGIISSKTASQNGNSLSVSFTYTATGAVRSQTSDGVTLTYTYDNRGNVLSETETDGAQTVKNEYTYDARNLRISYNTYRNGAQISNQYYTYNALGQLVESGELVDASWDETLYREEVVTVYATGPITADAYKIKVGQEDELGTYTTYTGSSAYGHSGLWIGNTLYVFSLNDLGEELFDATGNIDLSSGGYINVGGDSNVPISIQTSSGSNIDGDSFYIFDGTGTVIYTILLHPMHYYGSLYVGNLDYDYSNTIISQTTNLVPYTVHHEVYNEVSIVSYTYDARGNVLTETKDNNTSTAYTYTAEGLVKTKTNYTGNAVTSSFTYTYYPNGNVATETTSTGKVTTYLYDDLGRLVSEAVTGTSNNGTITYTYDNRGNRLTQTRDGITVSYTYDLNNRLTTSTENGVTGYTYDANGNTLSVMGTSGSATYTYDLFNRQKTHTSGGVVTTTTYRPDGLRHSIGGTKHIWDGQNIVGEYVGTAYKKYFRALTLIYRLASNTKQWYNTNGHGDVISLTDTNGVVVKTYTYNAFGEEEDISTTDGNPFRYCGEYYDTACGTLYLRARNYDATTGRFTQQDGWEYIDHSNPLTANLYTYCWNNPVNAYDPSGHFLVPVIALAVLFAGAAVALTSCEENAPRKDLAKAESIIDMSADELDSLSPYSYNCYGNGIGKKIATKPSGYKPGESTETTFEHVKSDLGEDNVRPLESIDDSIYDDEFMVALRCGKDDFHFIRRLDDGTWYNKSGMTPGVLLTKDQVKNGIFGDGIWYGMFGLANGMICVDKGCVYDDETIIYFAVKKGWDKK